MIMTEVICPICKKTLKSSFDGEYCPFNCPTFDEVGGGDIGEASLSSKDILKISCSKKYPDNKLVLVRTGIEYDSEGNVLQFSTPIKMSIEEVKKYFNV